MNARFTPFPLFDIGTVRAVALVEADIPELQQFFETNPEYFVAVTGQPPGSGEAHNEFHEDLPPGWPFTRKWLIGFSDDSQMIGMANVISDLLAERVWHIGLFVVATSLHGSGTAQVIYEHLESWMRDQGAEWIRLGVVEGNIRAEHFWERVGYREVRKRSAVEMGLRFNTLRAMVKPLSGGTLQTYLTLVARDRP